MERDSCGWGTKGGRALLISKTCLILPLALIVGCVVDRISGLEEAHSMRHASYFNKDAEFGKWPMCRAAVWF
jgi:hypothetical protein